jgi:uncharacterized protein
MMCDELTVRIAIVSDTHLPRGKRRLPGSCVERLQTADLIVHAGDFVTLSVLHELESFGVVVGVHGNVDDADVRAALPERAVVESEGARIGIVHDAGPSRGRIRRLRGRFPNVDAVVFGHSHIPLHERMQDGFQIFNPGSPTDRRFAPVHTMGIAEVQAGQVAFELVTLS